MKSEKLPIIKFDKHPSNNSFAFTIWFDRIESSSGKKYYRRSFLFHWLRKAWKENNIKPRFSIHSNNAEKGDGCFDGNITLGYLILNYTNWNY